MAIIKPFKAIRPTKELASKVAELPYDVYNREEAKKVAEGNPYSFLHIDKAEIDFEDSVNQYDERVYQKALLNLQNMITNKQFLQDETECLYIYSLYWQNKEHTGLVCCTSVDDYNNKVIKKHEFTRVDKENDRVKHVKTLNAHTGPIFLTYRASKDIDLIINDFKENNEVVYDIKERDGVKQKVWVIRENEKIEKLKNLFGEIPNLYIADGHHRNQAAALVAKERREKGEDPSSEFNFYLSILFPDNQVNVLDYNRVVKDLNGLSKDEFLCKIKDKFSVIEVEPLSKPNKKGEFIMYDGDKWFKLNIKDEFVPKDDVVNALDCAILQNEILSDILEIKDPRTDKRIDFIGGIRGIEELQRRVDNGEMKVAFALFSTSVSELMSVADDDKIMPPKSTWFEPKLRSGLFIHDLQ